MIFNSTTYLFFFLPLVIVSYWQLPLRARQWTILASSLLFYGFWRMDFIPLMLFSALLDYFLSRKISKNDHNEVTRKRLMLTSVFANLTILGVFKYLIFFRDSAWSIAESIGYEPSYVELNIILPLGISFYVFQTLSYTIDVYRRKFPVERDILSYLCFVTFFPQLVAGPILRASDLIPKLKVKMTFSVVDLRVGLERIIVGLVMKTVIADGLAGFVDEGFARDPTTLSGIDTWTLAFLFGFQIYFDFAGYSSIAIGSARLLGFKIPENFNFPYASSSPRDFWRRWHISLSSWISDYLYKPIIGATQNQVNSPGVNVTPEIRPEISQFRRTWGLYATWAIMGLWHGAAWTFVLWGLFHAFVIHMHRTISKYIQIPSTGLLWFVCLALTLPIMMAGWIPFRAESVADSFIMWGTMLHPLKFMGISLSANSYLIASGLAISIPLRFLWVSSNAHQWMKNSCLSIPLNISYHGILFSLMFVYLQNQQTFIYFQF